MNNKAAHQLSVDIVSFKEHKNAIKHIRTDVFIKEQGIPESLEWDEYEHSSWHAVAYINNIPVGTGRLQQDGKITRIAVLKAYRGNGVASAILKQLLALAAKHKLHALYLNAQTSAASMYEKYGFIREGEPFDEGGIEHTRMRRK